MWGITVFGLVVVIVAIGVIWAVATGVFARHSSAREIHEATERELGVRETTIGEEESPFNRPRTGA